MSNNILRRVGKLTLFAWMLILLIYTPWWDALAQSPRQSVTVAGSADVEEGNGITQSIDRLAEIRQQVLDKRREVEEVRSALKKEKDEELSLAMRQRLEELPKSIDKLVNSFEQIAIGGVDLGPLSDQPEDNFNWQEELLQITRPLFSSLKDLTEKPRRIERLRADMLRYDQRLMVVDRALASVRRFQEANPPPIVAERLKAIEEGWQQRRIEIENALEIAQYQIATLQGDTSSWAAFLGSLKGFVSGRGLTLLIALVISLLVWQLMHLLLRLVYRFLPATETMKRQRNRNRDRVITYIYRALTIVMVVVSIMAVFYTRSDLLLLALMLITVIMFSMGLRQTIPKYIREIRILLDFGSVREGERLVYNGIPLEVKNIQAFAFLLNPELEGVLRLPLDKLSDLDSRPECDEPWFPSSTGDFVMFSDGRLGEVLFQSLELVQLRMAGTQVQIPTTDYTGLTLRNLSRVGYGIPVVFGIDYRHQAICLDSVPLKMKEAVHAALVASPCGEHLADLLVEFKEAAANSLDYLVYVTMKGPAASNYYSIGRLVQQTLVELCNKEGWVIPFSQLTIHQGEGFDRLPLSG